MRIIVFGRTVNAFTSLSGADDDIDTTRTPLLSNYCRCSQRPRNHPHHFHCTSGDYKFLTPPHIFYIFFHEQDDLGFYDTAVYNPNSPTPTLKSLADGGVRLGRHYT